MFVFTLVLIVQEFSFMFGNETTTTVPVVSPIFPIQFDALTPVINLVGGSRNYYFRNDSLNCSLGDTQGFIGNISYNWTFSYANYTHEISTSNGTLWLSQYSNAILNYNITCQGYLFAPVGIVSSKLSDPFPINMHYFNTTRFFITSLSGEDPIHTKTIGSNLSCATDSNPQVASYSWTSPNITNFSKPQVTSEFMVTIIEQLYDYVLFCTVTINVNNQSMTFTSLSYRVFLSMVNILNNFRMFKANISFSGADSNYHQNGDELTCKLPTFDLEPTSYVWICSTCNTSVLINKTVSIMNFATEVLQYNVSCHGVLNITGSFAQSMQSALFLVNMFYFNQTLFKIISLNNEDGKIYKTDQSRLNCYTDSNPAVSTFEWICLNVSSMVLSNRANYSVDVISSYYEYKLQCKVTIQLSSSTKTFLSPPYSVKLLKLSQAKIFLTNGLPIAQHNAIMVGTESIVCTVQTNAIIQSMTWVINNLTISHVGLQLDSVNLVDGRNEVQCNVTVFLERNETKTSRSSQVYDITMLRGSTPAIIDLPSNKSNWEYLDLGDKITCRPSHTVFQQLDKNITWEFITPQNVSSFNASELIVDNFSPQTLEYTIKCKIVMQLPLRQQWIVSSWSNNTAYRVFVRAELFMQLNKVTANETHSTYNITCVVKNTPNPNNNEDIKIVYQITTLIRSSTTWHNYYGGPLTYPGYFILNVSCHREYGKTNFTIPGETHELKTISKRVTASSMKLDLVWDVANRPNGPRFSLNDTIKCSITTDKQTLNPEHVLIQYKFNFSLFVEKVDKYYTTDREFMKVNYDRVSHLRIVNIGEGMEIDAMCIFYAPITNETWNSTVRLIVRIPLKKFWPEPPLHRVRTGEEINCTATGWPKPKIDWIRTSEGTFDFIATEDGSLRIQYHAPLKRFTYQCRITDSYEVTETYNITIVVMYRVPCDDNIVNVWTEPDTLGQMLVNQWITCQAYGCGNLFFSVYIDELFPPVNVTPIHQEMPGEIIFIPLVTRGGLYRYTCVVRDMENKPEERRKMHDFTINVPIRNLQITSNSKTFHRGSKHFCLADGYPFPETEFELVGFNNNDGSSIPGITIYDNLLTVLDNAQSGYYRIICRGTNVINEKIYSASMIYDFTLERVSFEHRKSTINEDADYGIRGEMLETEFDIYNKKGKTGKNDQEKEVRSINPKFWFIYFLVIGYFIFVYPQLVRHGVIHEDLILNERYSRRGSYTTENTSNVIISNYSNRGCVGKFFCKHHVKRDRINDDSKVLKLLSNKKSSLVSKTSIDELSFNENEVDIDFSLMANESLLLGANCKNVLRLIRDTSFSINGPKSRLVSMHSVNTMSSDECDVNFSLMANKSLPLGDTYKRRNILRLSQAETSIYTKASKSGVSKCCNQDWILDEPDVDFSIAANKSLPLGDIYNKRKNFLQLKADVSIYSSKERSLLKSVSFRKSEENFSTMANKSMPLNIF